MPIHQALDATGKKWDVVEVFGKWDDPTAQKVTADAIAVQKHFDGYTAQGGDTGVVQAIMDAKQPFAPFGGMKQSGYGRLGGQEGLHEFLQVKNVWMNLAKPQGAK